MGVDIERVVGGHERFPRLGAGVQAARPLMADGRADGGLLSSSVAVVRCCQKLWLMGRQSAMVGMGSCIRLWNWLARPLYPRFGGVSLAVHIAMKAASRKTHMIEMNWSAAGFAAESFVAVPCVAGTAHLPLDS